MEKSGAPMKQNLGGKMRAADTSGKVNSADRGEDLGRLFGRATHGDEGASLAADERTPRGAAIRVHEEDSCSQSPLVPHPLKLTRQERKCAALPEGNIKGEMATTTGICRTLVGYRRRGPVDTTSRRRWQQRGKSIPADLSL